MTSIVTLHTYAVRPSALCSLFHKLFNKAGVYMLFFLYLFAIHYPSLAVDDVGDIVYVRTKISLGKSSGWRG